jgi:outer membrane receptor for ferrienterochelin and colicins
MMVNKILPEPLGAMAILALLGNGLLWTSAGEVAAAPNFVLPGIVVTATRTTQDVKKVPAATQVITEEDIKRSGAVDLRGVLAQQTNIMLGRHLPSGTEIMIRGMNTNQTLFLVDGMRQANEESNSAGNTRLLDRINLNSVQRIEIVRGAASAIYGTDALGGVINIITKDAGKPGGSVGLATGRGSMENWYHLDSGKMGKLSTSLDLRFNKLRKIKNGDANTWNSYGPSQTYQLKAKYNFDKDRSLIFNAEYLRQKLVSDNEGAGDYHTWNDYSRNTLGLTYQAKSRKNAYQLRTYLSTFRWDDHETNSFPAFDFNRNSHKLWALEGSDTYRPDKVHRLTLGGEYLRNQVEGTDLNDGGDNLTTESKGGVTKNASEKRINNYAFYVQDEMSFKKLLLIPALRYDHHDSFGGHLSPKIGVTYSAQKNLRFKANYGEGFKAPSIMALYYHLHMLMGPSYYTIYGNPDLQPEEAKNFDVSVEGELGKSFGKVSWFRNRVKNLITTETIATRTSRYVNVGRAKIEGWEVEAGWKFNDRLTFKTGATWLDARDEDQDSYLNNRSRFTGLFQLSYDDQKDQGWSWVLWDELHYKHRIGNLNVSGSAATTAGTDHTYNLLNLTVTRKVSPRFRVYAGVDNIFDKKDTDAYLDGRFWRTGLEYNF